jgi:hypothetical protein
VAIAQILVRAGADLSAETFNEGYTLLEVITEKLRQAKWDILQGEALASRELEELESVALAPRWALSLRNFGRICM